VIPFSATSKQGREELYDIIDGIIEAENETVGEETVSDGE